MEDLTALAAAVARQSLDLNMYAAFLIESLAGVLPPEYLTIERARSLFRRKDAPVVRASVRIGNERYDLVRESPTATPRSAIAHESGGIVLRTDAVPLDAWSRRLAAALATLAAGNADAAAALARLTSYTV